MKTVVCCLLLLWAGGAGAQEHVLEDWEQEGWKGVLYPNNTEGMPVTWAQGYWKLEAPDPRTGTSLTVQIQFRNNSPRPLKTMQLAALLIYPGKKPYGVVGLEWAAAETEPPLGEHEVLYGGWLVPGFAIPDVDEVREVVVWWPCTIDYTSGDPWTGPRVGEDEDDYCTKNIGAWFPAGFHKRMGIIPPPEQ